MTQSRDKCEQPCCEANNSWLGFILAMTVFMALLMGAGYAVLTLLTMLARVIGLLFGIGW